ncbi:MAG TPA: FAD-dependent oxidoreductase [Candidatus Dormibacteraeota bacterium]|nr:FAD-dependent oxidoreductase [Candidatus Dormibacteraeota bacterium]
MAKQRVVIVGGGSGGDAAAFMLRKKAFDGEVTILSADHDRPYDRPYLSKEFLRGEIELPKVYLHPEEDYARQGIELRLETRVSGGSLGERRLDVESGGHVDYDVLILSLGGTPRRLPGVPDAENVFTLRSLRDSSTIKQALQASRRLLLVGAGFIGAEVGASARTLGKDVLMVEAAPVPLSRALGDDVGRLYASIHRDHGVDVRTGTTVKEWHVDHNRVTGVTLSDGKREPVDMVLLAVGIDPNLDLPRALDLPIEGPGVRADEALKAAEGVYVAGDIALHHHPLLGRAIRVEHWEVAKGQGRGIANSIAAGSDIPYAKVPYFWSDQYDVSLEYRGNASGEDQAVWRGDRDGLRFSVFYLRDGVVCAVLSMNDKEGGEAGSRLIESRQKVDQKALGDSKVDLAELVPAGKSG